MNTEKDDGRFAILVDPDIQTAMLAAIRELEANSILQQVLLESRDRWLADVVDIPIAQSEANPPVDTGFTFGSVGYTTVDFHERMNKMCEDIRSDNTDWLKELYGSYIERPPAVTNEERIGLLSSPLLSSSLI